MDFAGKNGFIWWIGTIEDRQDPIKLGRCRVRCAGWHSDDKMKLPTVGLPWAFVSLPTNNANPYAPKEGDMVYGFFIDGENAQQPVIIGILPSIPLSASNAQQAFGDGRSPAELAAAPVKPDESTTLYPRKLDEPTTSRLARNDTDYASPILKSKIDKKSTTFEYPTAYKTKYPYNNAMESESGHVIEIDDTPSAERIHFYHRKGSYQEYRPDGSVQAKVVKNSQQAVDGDKNVYVKGNYTVNVDGNLLFNVKGSITAVAGDSISTKSGSSTSMTAGTTWSALGPISASMTSAGQATVTGAVKAALTSLGFTDVKGGATSVSASGALDCSAGGAASYSAKGVATLAGSVVNILGAPVGGVGTPDSVAAATDALVNNVDPFEVSGGGAILFDANADSAISGIVEGVQVTPEGVVSQADNALTEFAGSSSDLSSVSETFDASTLTPEEVSELALPTDQPVQIIEDGNVISTTDGQYSTFSDTYKDGTQVQFTVLNETGEVTEVSVIEKSALDKALAQAENVGNSMIEAASKVDPVKYVEQTGKSLATQVTQPFLDSKSVVEKSVSILSSDTATLSQKFSAAKTILGEGLNLTNKATSVAQIVSNPQAIILAAGTNIATQSANDFTRELSKTQAVKDVRSDIQSIFGGYTQKIKDTYSDTTKSINDHIQNAMNEFELSSPSVSAEVAQNLVDLRAAGYTESDLRQIMPDVIKRYPKEFAKAYSGDPLTAASAFDQENGSA